MGAYFITAIVLSHIPLHSLRFPRTLIPLPGAEAFVYCETSFCFVEEKSSETRCKALEKGNKGMAVVVIGTGTRTVLAVIMMTTCSTEESILQLVTEAVSALPTFRLQVTYVGVNYDSRWA